VLMAECRIGILMEVALVGSPLPLSALLADVIRFSATRPMFVPGLHKIRDRNFQN
jgi:hypothetical protein